MARIPRPRLSEPWTVPGGYIQEVTLAGRTLGYLRLVPGTQHTYTAGRYGEADEYDPSAGHLREFPSKRAAIRWLEEEDLIQFCETQFQAAQ